MTTSHLGAAAGYVRVKEKTVRGLLEGAIDLHAHFAPDGHRERSVNANELMQNAADLKLRAVALKSKSYPSYPLALLGKQQHAHLEPLGGICLDRDIGGLNPDAVQVAGRSGNRIVWLPTFTSAGDMAAQGKAEMGISCLDRQGNLSEATLTVMREVQKHDMVLATGHISNEETMLVVRKAHEMGMKRVVITHPITARVGGTPTMEMMKEYVRLGAYLEHCFIGVTGIGQCITPTALAEAIREIGAEHCIMSSDYGQVWNPPPAYGLKMFIATMLAMGLTEAEVETMVKTNPAKIVGLR